MSIYGYEATLCWKCKNTYADKCCWFKDFTPVPGWDAVPTKLSAVSEARVPRYVESYLVRRCPNYEPLEGFEPIEGQSAPFDKNMKGSKDMKGVNAERQALIEKREELYKAGATDAEIAGTQRVGIETVRAWRVKRGYPKNPDRTQTGELADAADKSVSKTAETVIETAETVIEQPENVIEAGETPAADAATEVSRIFEKQMEKLEECRVAGMIVSDKPWDGEEPDPYVYDGSMSPEDFERRSEMLRAEREAEGRNKMTVEALIRILANVPPDAVVTCAECADGFEWAYLRQEYDIHGNPGIAEILLGGER